jgi:glycine cleavage system aminomethyltransferase T
VRVGHITSAMYGHTLGRSIGLGYVSNAEGVTEAFIRDGRFELEIAGTRTFRARHAQAALRPQGRAYPGIAHPRVNASWMADCTIPPSTAPPPAT